MDDSSKRGVLVVEDDVELRDQVLVPGLMAFGFDVVGVGTAAELYRAIVGNRFQLIVLDVRLPDEDGFTVANHLRRISNLGIVMLTGLDSTADHIRGLKEGADIYLTKPIDVEVLAASLHSLARRIDDARSPASAPQSWRLEGGGWRLLAPNGVLIALSMAERLIVKRLLVSPGEPVARDVLIDELALHVEDFDASRLEMLIHRLRRKISLKAGHELPLTVVRRVGYMLAFD
ncbi:response regulator transcription factor [Dyella tabacisoli]|uniref:DNA-binding response regulator n=1 Tax=Dyella tabacisoli TaxID=2282381 RepID=A0A369UMP5_9GAMM|nr:response regulator transcription factor [Dyella tabacisoli]RDD81757.1 DNA-binding response regulator [Dyella tabacisoli]